MKKFAIWLIATLPLFIVSGTANTTAEGYSCYTYKVDKYRSGELGYTEFRNLIGNCVKSERSWYD